MANNTIGWGQGATNNNIGWGRGSSNDIGWGSVYENSYVGDTDIQGADARFIITVKTDNAGTSLSNQFTLPWIGTYDVEWGDGNSDVGVSGTQTHTYASAGTYDIAVTAASGQIYFNGVDDKAKLIEIKNWGAIQWTTMSRAFFDCNKLTTVSATDSPNLSAVSTLQLMFRNCTSLESVNVSNWDVSNVTIMYEMFFNCSKLATIDVSNWDTSSVTLMYFMFYNCSLLKADFAELDINSVTTFTNFAAGTNINETGTTTNYDNTLISWAAQTPQNNIVINFGTAKYSWRAIEARNTLVNTYNWTITDGGLADDDEFVITVRTTTSAETFTIPTTGGGYSYDVDWGDGSSSATQTGNATHTYATAGDYDIQITGTFPRILFNNTGDKAKLIDIKNWGNGTWSSFSSAFYGCSELTEVSAEDAPDLSSAGLIFNNAFAFCSKITSLNVSNWDVSGITSFSGMFQGCSLLTNLDVINWNVSSATDLSSIFNTSLLINPDVTNWDTSSATNMFRMFRITSLDRDLSGFNIVNVTNLTDFATGVTLSTANYDATLIGWEANLQATYPSGSGYTATININFGGSQYTAGSAAETARQSLISTFGWTITDGGSVAGLLDTYTGAAAAYSLRNLNGGTEIDVVRVRRASDNTEQDFTYSEIINGTLATFCSATDGFVVTWYDQSGSGNHATQGTASAQPQIVASGVVNLVNGMPAILSDGVDDYLSVAFSATNPTTQFFVYDKVGTSNYLGGLFATGNSAGAILMSSTGVYAYQTGPQFTPTYANNNQAVVSLKSSTIGTDWAMRGNGTSITNSGEDIGTFAPNNITLMSRGNLTQFGNTYFQEYIVYPSDQTSNQSAIESNINGYYSIY